MDSLKMIEEFSNAYGVLGFEDNVLEIGRKYGGHLGNITEDCLRNLYFWRKDNKGDKPIVMLDAHSDEVGFMVRAIRPNGTLEFIPLGGWVNNTIPAHKFMVRNSDGVYISGVVASKPPHFSSEEEKNRSGSIANMVIDVGASSAEEIVNDFKICIGAPVVPDALFEYYKERDIMCGKAFDCRLGCAAVLETLDEIKGISLKVDVVGTFTAQEESGLRGVKVAVQKVSPDIAILFEGSPADDTFLESYAAQTVLKKGPMLRHIDDGMITNPRFMRFVLDIAKKQGIAVQEGIRTRGATNGGAIHIANGGVPVIVIGIPVRYAHTHYGYSSYFDYRQGIELAKEIIFELDKERIQSF